MKPQSEIPNVLVIAGLDPSGGAGIIADLRAIDRLGFYGTGVVAALTAQNTQTVQEIYPVPPVQVTAQIEALLTDIELAAVKIGMLGTGENAAAVAAALAGISAPIVLDPVLASTSGVGLARQDLLEALRSELLPRCSVATPNLVEATALTGEAIVDMAGAQTAARRLVATGLSAVCITGGHWSGEPTDLFFDGHGFELLEGKRQGGGEEYHGTGCLFATATAVGLAQGKPALEALRQAKRLTERAIATAIRPGRGMGIPMIFPLA